jgi:hypothetical protein
MSCDLHQLFIRRPALQNLRIGLVAKPALPRAANRNPVAAPRICREKTLRPWNILGLNYKRVDEALELTSNSTYQRMWRPVISSWPRSMASVSAKKGRARPCHKDASLSTRIAFQELLTLYSTKYGWDVLMSVMGIAPWPSTALVDRVNATFVCSSGVICLCPSCIRTVTRRLVGLEIQ